MKINKAENNMMRTDEMRMNLDKSYIKEKKLIEIVVDCNNDTLRIDDGKKFDLERPYYTIEIVQAIFDAINLADILSVRLVRIDEDERRTIGEW